jgi:hypothetical protein|tara:strand:+ start:1626 stop:1826 length:201 start_codon:yes stop_codon:yes gene_type:complete
MEFTIKITNEELFKLILAQKKDNETNEVLEEPIKRGRGRPRIHPVIEHDAPRRPRGRPRKIRYNLN